MVSQAVVVLYPMHRCLVALNNGILPHRNATKVSLSNFSLKGCCFEGLDVVPCQHNRDNYCRKRYWDSICNCCYYIYWILGNLPVFIYKKSLLVIIRLQLRVKNTEQKTDCYRWHISFLLEFILIGHSSRGGTILSCKAFCFFFSRL